MKQRIPTPSSPKTRLQMVAEYELEIRTFNRKLIRHGVVLPPGLILPGDQVRVYKALGPPVNIWVGGRLVPFNLA